MNRIVKLFGLLLVATMFIHSHALAFDQTSLTDKGNHLAPEYVTSFKKYYYNDKDNQNFIYISWDSVQMVEDNVIFDAIIALPQDNVGTLTVFEVDFKNNLLRRNYALDYLTKNYKISQVVFEQPKEWESLANYPSIKKLALSAREHYLQYKV